MNKVIGGIMNAPGNRF